MPPVEAHYAYPAGLCCPIQVGEAEQRIVVLACSPKSGRLHGGRELPSQSDKCSLSVSSQLSCYLMLSC